MKPILTTRRIMLAVGAAVVFLLFFFSFAFKPVRPLPAPAPPSPAPIVMTDDEYYQIPDGVGYAGQHMTNKAGLLTLTSEMGQNYYLVSDTATNTGFLYAEVKADNYTPVGKQRLPLNISLVIDRSGSMEGAKLANVKKAAGFLVDRLNDKDMLSIVVYESNVGVLQKSVAVTDKKALHDIIDNIVTGGSTNLGGGMMEGFNQVKKSYRSGYVNRVLLLIDGLANEGITDLTVLANTAKKWFNTESISISTFGVGTDYNENLMTKIAENGGGNYYYIKEPDQIPGILEKEVNGLLAVVAQQAQLTFTLPAGINIMRVYGGNYDMDKNQMTINLKDIFANDTKAVLVKFKIKKGTNTDLVFASRLAFNDATDNGTPKAIDNMNVMKPVTDRDVYLKNFSERVMQQCTMFESNDMLEKAMKAVDDGKYDKARKMGENTQGYTKSNMAKFAPSKEMVMQDSVISSYNTNLKDIETKPDEQKNEMQKVSKLQNYYMRVKKVEEVK